VKSIDAFVLLAESSCSPESYQTVVQWLEVDIACRRKATRAHLM
jgi:hypothetical protein